MKKILIGSLLLLAAAQLGACGAEDEKTSSAYCCINGQYYSCSDDGARKCFDTLGSDKSGCSRDSSKDTSCK